MAPKEKRWYAQKVKKEWFGNPKYSVYKEVGECQVKCCVCSEVQGKPRVLPVAYRGRPVLEDHLGTELHKQRVQGASWEKKEKLVQPDCSSLLLIFWSAGESTS